MTDRTDRELVERARAGDANAIGALFTRYWRAARAAAFGVTGDVASAEDAAAEAFQEAVGGLDSLRDADRFGSWLRTIVVRKAQREWPRLPAAEDLPADLSDRAERPDQALERLEMAALIQRAVRELPTSLREAMALTYFEGYDSEAAARFLDIPPGTLRRRLHDGREQVRRTVGRILAGSTRMVEKQERQLEHLRSLVEEGATYRAIREILAIRPPPGELVDLLMRRHSFSVNATEHAARAADGGETLPTRMRSITTPSARASDPRDPVGATAAAIRATLPEFHEWRFDTGDAAARFLSFAGERLKRLEVMLPPGFAEGRPGAFLRSSRGLVRVRADGAVESVYELLQESPDARTFEMAMQQVQISDVIDLTWMVAGVLELRAVEELVAWVAGVVIPAADLRFSLYDEPRYRSALQMYEGNGSARLASGGVLAEWPGRPGGVDAAHVRLFLEPWAEVRSGKAVAFDRIPRRG